MLLLIILEGGVLVFSYSFTDEWKRDSELFGSFLSAFTSFSDEYFSEELDRAKFGHYTVFMKAIAKFSDDGIMFRGAYGPKVVEQLGYVTQNLLSDPDSRQAVININNETDVFKRQICAKSSGFKKV